MIKKEELFTEVVRASSGRVLDIISLLGLRYDASQSTSKRYRCQCPNASAHKRGDKSFSFDIYDKPNGIDCYCASCQEVKGNIILLYGYVNNTTPYESAIALMEHFGLEMEDDKSKKKAPSAHLSKKQYDLLGINMHNYSETTNTGFRINDEKNPLNALEKKEVIKLVTIEEVININKNYYDKLLVNSAIAKISSIKNNLLSYDTCIDPDVLKVVIQRFELITEVLKKGVFDEKNLISFSVAKQKNLMELKKRTT